MALEIAFVLDILIHTRKVRQKKELRFTSKKKLKNLVTSKYEKHLSPTAMMIHKTSTPTLVLVV